MKVKVKAMMTAGRYENTFCRNVIDHSMRALGIPLEVSIGVFYGQCMQMMFERACKEDADYIITVDGDSLFKPKQLQRLLSIIAQEGMEALCAMQLRRGKPHALATIEGQNSAVWNGYPIQVTTAHFGLTVLSVNALREVAKPWFFCQADENGEWGDNKIDSDIWFWKNWKEAGHRVFIDPGTCIGHMEEMVSIYDADYNPIHMYPNDWITGDVGETDPIVEIKAQGVAG
jgi:hypothetical protein